jgi:hypothetical protein
VSLHAVSCTSSDWSTLKRLSRGWRLLLQPRPLRLPLPTRRMQHAVSFPSSNRSRWDISESRPFSTSSAVRYTLSQVCTCDPGSPSPSTVRLYAAKVKPPSPPPTAQPILDNAAPPAGPASAVNAPAQAGAEQQRLPAVVPVWAPKSTLDVALKLSTDEDPLNVDLRDQTLPGVTWEGIEYASGKWNRVWETEWNVPEVGPLGSLQLASS